MDLKWDTFEKLENKNMRVFFTYVSKFPKHLFFDKANFKSKLAELNLLNSSGSGSNPCVIEQIDLSDSLQEESVTGVQSRLHVLCAHSQLFRLACSFLIIW